ncbi:MAG: tetratricopeptide repeat protein [Oscillospiraceae bacterium]|nr:tetratricopeptide repeat protein [Oscillospiraceae bacterium]
MTAFYEPGFHSAEESKKGIEVRRNTAVNRIGLQPVPIPRILDKLESYLSLRDYEGAERHLLYWLSEAEDADDGQGQFALCNELIGHYRKTGKKREALCYAGRALEMIRVLELDESIAAATAYVNAATAYNAFEETEKAVRYFEKAKTIYEASPAVSPSRLGALYNNMGLAFTALKRFEEAMQLYEKAIEEMEKMAESAPELAVTLLNMADTVAARSGMLDGEARIRELLQAAYSYLKDEHIIHDSCFAFVCEKCIPAFSYYGFFSIASELQREVERIYEGA